MRQQFVECTEIKEAEKACPWATIILWVDGGYMCFESYADSFTWGQQS